MALNAPAQPAPVEHRIATLTKNDRCDGCGAEAFVEAKAEREKDGLPVTRVLLFCAHHFRNSEENLVKSGWRINDERWRLEDPA